MVNDTPHFVIFGASGFVGTAVLERLAAMPPGSVRASVLLRDKNKIEPYPFADYYIGELPYIPMGLLPSCPHVILHLANKNIDRDETGFAVNLQATKAIIRAANRWTMGIIYGSSLSVLGQGTQKGVTEIDDAKPQTPLAQSRLDAEKALCEYAAKSGKSVLMLRPRFIIGKKDAYTIPAFAEFYRKGFMAGTGNQKYSFIDVDDYAQIILKLSSLIAEWHRSKTARCTPVNIGYREAVSLKDLNVIFSKAFGVENKPVLRIPPYRWLAVLARRSPFRKAHQLATRLELLGFSHYSDVSLLISLVGDDIPAKDPEAVLRENIHHYIRGLR